MSRTYGTKLALALAVGLLLSLVPTAVMASGGDEQSMASGEVVEIVWLFTENPADINLDKLIATFEAQNPNLKIKSLYTPSRAVEKIHTLIASGDPPDLMRLNDDYVQDYAVRGILMPLDDFIQKRKLDTKGFIKAFWDWPQVGGKHMSWVKGLTAEVVWINVEAFEQSGVALPSKESWTWDDFLATAKKMTVTAGSETKRYGGSISHTFPSHEVTWAANNGGNVYSADGRKFVLAEPKGAEAVQWVADLALKHKVQPAFSMWGQFDRTDLFASGTLAMFNGDSRQIPSLTRKVEGKFKWAARPIPGKVNYKSGGAFDSHVIPAGAKHPAEAFKWLAFLTSEEAYKIMGEVGFWLPANPDWAATYWLPNADLPLDKDVAIRALDNYLPVPKTTNTEQARLIYWPQIKLVMNGDISAEKALKAVEKEVNELLAEF